MATIFILIVAMVTNLVICYVGFVLVELLLILSLHINLLLTMVLRKSRGKKRRGFVINGQNYEKIKL